MSAGRRGISEEEDALFRASLTGATQLKPHGRAPEMLRTVAPPVRPYRPILSPEPQYNEQPAAAIGGHVQAHLRRGRSEPEARLDLHGLRRDRAYRTLTHFLLRAQSDGKRLVLVITGKGGVLRDALPYWLGSQELGFLVAGLSEAHVKHGGAGAFYVRLRRPSR